MADEEELLRKHEEIIGRRVELLEQMTGQKDQLVTQKEQHVRRREAAHSRNASLLQDLQKIEDSLGRRLPPQPNLLVMETQFWESVEESLPSWEPFLLGRGPPPPDSQSPPRRLMTSPDQGRPPRSKAGAHR